MKEIHLTRMCKSLGTGLRARRVISLSGHFLHLCFGLTWIDINHDRVEGHLTIAS